MNHWQQALGWFFRDREGRIVIAQTPNLPLIGWAILWLAAFLAPPGPWERLCWLFGFGFLFTWAYLELTDGANPFRRCLGGGVLLGLVAWHLYGISVRSR